MTSKSRRPADLKGSRLPDPNRMLAVTARTVCDGAYAAYMPNEGVTVADADPALGAEWAPRVREAMSTLRRFQKMLDEMERSVTVTGRPCAYCGGPIPEQTPRSTYCRRSCRQRAYEARNGLR